jgi:hypothetical protein
VFADVGPLGRRTADALSWFQNECAVAAQGTVGDSTTKWIAGRINEWFGLKSAIRDW